MGAAVVFDDADTYGPSMRARYAELLAEPGAEALLEHCVRCRRRASKSWRREAGLLLREAGRGVELVRGLLDGFLGQRGQSVLVRAGNERVVVGAVWVAAGIDQDWVPGLLGAVTRHAGSGVCRNGVVASAGVHALGALAGGFEDEAGVELTLIQELVRNAALRKAAAQVHAELAVRSQPAAPSRRPLPGTPPSPSG